jgi:polar amino acid transport system substrate-binding protein
MRTRSIVFVASLGLVLAACTGGASTAPSAEPSAAPSAATSTEPSAAPSAAASATACSGGLPTLTAGTLTIGADNAAYPPYFMHRATGNTAPWEDQPWTGDPTTGEGLESAVAYEVAERMGFDAAHVVWTPMQWGQSFAPGDKPFDMHVSQVSWNADRASVVDLSDGYFDLNQSVVGNAGSPIDNVTTVSGLRDFTLGAPAATTSYQYIVDTIRPTKEPHSYDTLDLAIKALDAKQIDGIVMDIPSAFIAVAAQLNNGTIVGELPTVGEVEHFSIVLPKGSALTACVNETLAAMKADGTLKRITDKWITGGGAQKLT